MTDFVFTRYGLHGGDSCTRSPSGRLSGPLSLAQSPHHVPVVCQNPIERVYHY